LIKDFLKYLTEKITPLDMERPEKKASFKKPQTDDSELCAAYIYPRLQEFFQPNDIIFAETGIIGIKNTKNNNNNKFKLPI
jgi:indolepyruvate decarboxylase